MANSAQFFISGVEMNRFSIVKVFLNINFGQNQAYEDQIVRDHVLVHDGVVRRQRPEHQRHRKSDR
jgi:hypothetical protein